MGQVFLSPLSPTKFHFLPLYLTVKAGEVGAGLSRVKRGIWDSSQPTLGGLLAHLEGQGLGPVFRDYSWALQLGFPKLPTRLPLSLVNSVYQSLYVYLFSLFFSLVINKFWASAISLNLSLFFSLI